ncbi:MAG TPA: hypothetical protein VHX38_18490 [Pseudonocardiaceae bacterium]|jgi:germacradienol/geosmin synthase|nr:hypothetical protein [Pseudonocardiaceae bacterium]
MRAPFELPEVGTPFPVRANPHIEAARRQLKDWVAALGLLADGSIWTEADVDAADYARFAGLAHPDAGRSTLELLADWHTLLYYIDDLSAKVFKPSGNLAAVRLFLTRLAAFMPEDGRPAPTPTTSVERGILDLWNRSVLSMNPRLRGKLPGLVAEIGESTLWEMANLLQGRTADPVDHLEMRRRSVGADFSATLAQHGAGVLLPPEVADARPIRALLDIFADVKGLSNDIVSYAKEAADGELLNNGIEINAAFLDTDLPHAVAIHADLMNSRLRQFTDIATNDVPGLTAEFDLGPAASAAVGRYVGMLSDWLAGYVAWAGDSGRYPQAVAVPSATDLPGTAPKHVPDPAGLASGRSFRGPTGLGTSAAALFTSAVTSPHPVARSLVGIGVLIDD